MSQHAEVRDPMGREAHLLDLTQDAIFFWEFGGPGRAGPITVWNPASARLYGYTPLEALGRIGHELLRTRHPQGTPAAFERDLERTGEWRGELGHTTRDGRELVVESHQLLVADPDGRRWVLESNRDVTGRKRAEEELRQSEERFRNLAETAHEGIWLIDLDARTLFANARMAELLGTSVTSITGRPVHEFCFPEDVARAQERIGQNLHGQVEQFEFRFRRLDGTAVHMLASTSPVRDASGRIVGALGMFSDFTERKLAEEARQRLERDKDAFFAAVSHDLKNPLTSIKAAAQLIRRRVSRGRVDPASLESGIANIDAAAARMTAQIDALLDVGRLRMGRALDLELAPTDLVELVRQAISEQQLMAERHKIVLEAGEDEIIGVWDAPRLQRVLGNLLNNAVKFSPDGGGIRVSLAREQVEAGTWAVLAVTDHGLGIPAEDLPYVFDNFHRAANVAGTIPGSGIGLASVRQIVEQHGGNVLVSSCVGEGSTFTMRLPVGDPERSASTTSRREVP